MQKEALELNQRVAAKTASENLWVRSHVHSRNCRRMREDEEVFEEQDHAPTGLLRLYHSLLLRGMQEAGGRHSQGYTTWMAADLVKQFASRLLQKSPLSSAAASSSAVRIVRRMFEHV